MLFRSVDGRIPVSQMSDCNKWSGYQAHYSPMYERLLATCAGSELNDFQENVEGSFVGTLGPRGGGSGINCAFYQQESKVIQEIPQLIKRDRRRRSKFYLQTVLRFQEKIVSSTIRRNCMDMFTFPRGFEGRSTGKSPDHPSFSFTPRFQHAQPGRIHQAVRKCCFSRLNHKII